MSGASSNADAIKAKLEALVRSINFITPGKQGSLGEDCLAIATQSVLARTLGDQKSPDGTPLAENRGEYGRKKATKGLPVGVGPKGRKKAAGRPMLSEVEVAGERDIRPDSASMKYGRSDAARKKGEWFTAGDNDVEGCERSGASGQPARPFYGLDDAARAEIRAECEGFVAALVREFNGG